MDDITAQIDALLGGPRPAEDVTGCLSVIHGVLEPFSPDVVWVADLTGHIVATHQTGTKQSAEDLRRQARDLAAELGYRGLVLRATRPEAGTGFATVVVGPRGGTMVLGGLLCCPPETAQGLRDDQAMLERMGSIAVAAIDAAARVSELQVRVRHLEAEQDTLKASYEATITSVVEERERRAQEERAYVVRLENEVTRRSADLRQALDDANRANRAKGEFLANMSHEIRTPMTAILGFAENLLNPHLTEAERLDAVHTVRRNGEHLLQILNDVLDLSKMEAGRFDICLAPCSPIEVIADAQSLMRVPASSKGITLDVAFDGPIPETIHSDAIRLRQILFNLLSNAIKFTEKGGVRLVARISPECPALPCAADAGPVSAEAAHQGEAVVPASPPRGPFLQFDVIDSGIGMSEEQQKAIFHPFTQADASLTRKYGGTGLGLAISLRLAEMLGGTITCESVPSQGSTFHVWVAAGSLEGVARKEQPSTATLLRPDAETNEPAKRLNCRILLAEDGPDNQRLISFILKKSGADVQIAENGRIAFETALAAEKDGSPFDIILMDMQMPEIDGYEATSILRSKGYAGTIIALTAHALGSDRDKCLKAGCDDYAVKPIDRHKLVEIIAAHLARRQRGTRA